MEISTAIVVGIFVVAVTYIASLAIRERREVKAGGRVKDSEFFIEIGGPKK